MANLGFQPNLAVYLLKTQRHAVIDPVYKHFSIRFTAGPSLWNNAPGRRDARIIK